MNNPYRQFTVQPRRNARFQANTHSGNYNNLNFHDPALATVRLLSPAVAHANQQMYSALYSNTPVMAVDGTPDYCAVDQAAFAPMYMMNSHPGMAVMPAIPIDFRNQRSRVHHPANFPDAADLLGHCVTENAAVLPNNMPALQPQAVFAGQTHNIHSLPRVPVTESKVMNTANLLSANVQIPFRQVQWIPPAVQETGVPQVPFAVEIKPEIDGTPQNCVPAGNFSMTNSEVPVNDASCETECGNDWSVPTVYLDIATDSSSHCLDANTRTADAPSVICDVTVVNAADKTGRRKRIQCESYSGVKVLKLCNGDIVKHSAVSLAPRRDSTVVTSDCPESDDSVEEVCVVDDEEVNESEVDARPVPVQEQERLSNEDTALSPSTPSAASEPGELIGSDEDVGDGDAPLDYDTCVPNEDDSSENLECYEVMPTNSDALLFDMECDGEKDGETLRVIVPTKNVETAAEKTATSPPLTPKDVVTATTKTATSLPKTPKNVKTATTKTAMPLLKTQITLDDDDPDVVIVEPKHRTRSVPVTRSQRLAARVRNLLQTVSIKKSENSFLGVPVQSSFFRFETQSSEVFRLLSMEKSFVPRNVLTQLTELVSSINVTTDDNQCSSSDMTSGIPGGGSRKLLFQCLFCPYGELSAKRVMGHVKQQHRNYASFLQRSLLPNCQTLLYIYCRHCNFITYDSAALFIHFAIYHKVAGILLSAPKVIESDPAWEPLVNPEDKAREFPFFCCPDCGYVDVERNRMTQHMLEKQSSESVFFGCVVRLIMVVRGSKPPGVFTYASLTREENHTMFRKEIYACVSCRFFSFYPTYAFSHYVVTHSCLEMLYVCAASPSCTKRCMTRDDIVSHIQGVHVAMKSLRFQCTATLLDSSALTQVAISPGELIATDVPVHLQYRSPSASESTSLEAAIEIVDDDDDDSDDDVVVLGPPQDRDISVDVEPDSPVSEERSGCTDVPVNAKPSSACVTAGQNVTEQKQSELCFGSTEHCLPETVTVHCGEENVEPDVMESIENGTLTVKASGATSDTIDSVCSNEDQTATELDHAQNRKADLSSHVEDESLKSVECDLQSKKTEEKQNTTESQSVESTINTNTPETSHAELVDSPFDSSFPSKDTSPLAGSTAVVTEMVNDISVPSNNESSTELESVQHLVPGTNHKESVDCVECSTSSSTNTNQLVCVSSLVNHVDKRDTESELAENPFPGASPVGSVDSAENPAFLNDNKNQLPPSATANDDSISDAASIPVSLEIHQSDDVQEGEHDRNVSEGEATSTQLNSVCTAEQEIVAFDHANEVDLFDCLLDEDSFPGFELGKSPSDRLESSERSSLDLQGEILMLAGQLTTDEPQHCSKVEHAVAACSVVSAAESVVDDSCIVSTENPCLGPHRESSENTSCSSAVEHEQLHTSANSWSREADVIDHSFQEAFTKSVLASCADCSCEKPSESRGSEVNAQVDCMSEQGNVSDVADRPVLRFKSLAGFRFPSPHPFTSKPS